MSFENSGVIINHSVLAKIRGKKCWVLEGNNIAQFLPGNWYLHVT